MFQQPNPNNTAYERQTFNESWKAHERFVGRTEINPIYRPSRPLRISSVVTKGQDSFYTFAPAHSSDKSTP